MKDKEFNLLHEPWIRVMRADSAVEELSLTDALLRAHEYVGLAGELPTQDIAVLRLLLAVMHAVFYRVDEQGDAAPLEDADEALERWQALWELGRLPEKPIRQYLERYEERFWLFHPERPFYQAQAAEAGSAFGAQKLNGAICEGGHKPRLFSSRTGEYKERLTYSQAARWLIHLNGFDDAGLKKKIRNDEGLPSFKVGWLGQLGLVAATGESLFETLMLNFVLTDQSKEVWSNAVPVWEKEQPDQRDRVWITAPHDQAALLTLQSRRIILKRENGYVTGHAVLSGEQFAPELAGSETMTMWRQLAKEQLIVPRKHRRDKALWREFSAMLGQQADGRKPGVVWWNMQVKLPEAYVIRYQAVSVDYSGGSIPSMLDEVISDRLCFHLNLLEEIGERWRDLILKETERCESLADAVGMLAWNIAKAEGGDGDAERTYAREQFFYRVDVPFRKWLLTLDARQPDTERVQRQVAWRREAEQIVKQLGQECVAQASIAAFQGRTVTVDEKTDKKFFYSAPSAYGAFNGRIATILK